MNLEDVATQITVENSPSPEMLNRGVNNRLNFINAKKKTGIPLLITFLIWSILRRWMITLVMFIQ